MDNFVRDYLYLYLYDYDEENCKLTCNTIDQYTKEVYITNHTDHSTRHLTFEVKPITIRMN